MEPFARQEEELQAHARVHRFGQKRPVSVTTYFMPRSCESRTLGLRADVLHLEAARKRQALRRAEEAEMEDLIDSDDEGGGAGRGGDDDDDDVIVLDGDAEEEEVSQFEKAKAESKLALYLAGVINSF